MRYFNLMKYRSALKIGLAILLVAFVTGTVFFVLRIRRHRSAEQILNKMAAAYRNCKTYQDSGIVQMVDKHVNVKLKFTTAFIRPDRFRYEYMAVVPEGINSRLIIWRKGKQVAAWWNLKPKLVEAPSSFNRAIMAASGVSLGTASTIPALLFSKNEIKRPRLTDMTDVTQLADAELGNVDCYRVKGSIGVLNTVAWIDKETFIVRKVERVTDRGAKIVATYNPVVNAKIPDTALEYNASQNQ